MTPIVLRSGHGKAAGPFPRTHYWRYCLLAFGVSWGCWWSAVILGRDVMVFPEVLLMFGGGVGPMVAALVLVLREHDRGFRWDYFIRAVDVRRIGAGWHLAIWLPVPALNLAAIVLTSGRSALHAHLGGLPVLVMSPLAFVSFALGVLLFGPVPEELGWRGYALDGLESRYTALTSSLLLGAIWALWHLPLFFMVGTFQHGQIGLDPVDFMAFNISLIASAVLYTWVYNNTGRSILSAILLHFVVNLSGEMMNLAPEARVAQSALFFLCAAAVVRFWGPETLTGRNEKAAG